MASSPFQITGVASGISWDEIIDSMIKSASKPKEQWQSRIDTLQYKKTLYQEVSSKIYALRSTMTSLKMPSAYKKKTAEYVVRTPAGQPADNIIKSTVNANAEIAQWDIDVKQLATSERVVSNQFSPGESLGITGKVRIQVGIQVAMLEITADDSIRTINQKINKLTAADGSAVAVSAQLIDNRLVINGALTGRDEEGPLAEVSMSMYESLTDDAGNIVSYLPQPSEYEPAPDDPKKQTVKGSFPKQIFMLKTDSTSYTYGTDFTYDSKTGKITWIKGRAHPADGETFTAVFETTLGSDGSLKGGSQSSVFGISSTQTSVAVKLSSGADGGAAQAASMSIPTSTDADGDTTVTAFGVDYLPALSGQKYNDLPGGSLYKAGDDTSKSYLLYDGSGKRLIEGTDYMVTEVQVPDGNGGYTNQQAIVWLKEPPTNYQITCGAGNDYKVSNRQMHLIEDDPTSKNSVLAKLGITTINEDDPTDPYVYYTNRSYAKDAKLTLNGVEVTRPTNTIPVEDDESDALIANVKLELVGEGHVTMNITQDASEIIENVQKFIDAYNEMLELINYRLEENETSANSNTSDTLQDILSGAQDKKVFGLLHGDSLLWSVKNQFRSYFSNSVSSVSGDLRSRKYLLPASALELSGSFYVNVGGKAAKIDVARTDSLVDIQRKLNDATAINSADGKTASGESLKLEVDIVDGQLVIKTPSKTTGTQTQNDTLKRSTTEGYDLLKYVPYQSSPVNGVLTVTSGSTTYTQGTDFEVTNVMNDAGVLESRLTWIQGGRMPDAGSSYNVSYSYSSDGVGYTMIPNSGDLSTLNLHYDSSSVQLSTLGISSTADDYGKSGLIDFDTDKFFAAIQKDSDMVSNVMLSFMETIDNYIGNLVDSSNNVVGGNIVTKGRFAAMYNRIDTEVSELQSRITNLERQMEEKQNALYKQYSSMEQSIQLLNAQMSSMANYFSNNNNNNNG